MENVILVIHLIVALAIIGLVLIQRSEGGGLGIGGSTGGGMGGFASPRGTADMLNKMTRIAAAAFFATSLTLAILAGSHNRSDGILAGYDNQAQKAAQENGAVAGDGEDVDAVLVDEEEGGEINNNVQAPLDSSSDVTTAEQTDENGASEAGQETSSERPSAPLGE